MNRSESKLLSIIIPVYNVEKYLSDCIDSVLTSFSVSNLDKSEIEIILVNDGSTDKSGKICDEYSKKYSLIKTFHKINGGLSSARNTGIAHAHGKWYTFIDSDDIVNMNYINIIVSLIKKANLDLIMFKYLSFKSFDEIKDSINNFNYDEHKLKLLSKKEAMSKLFDGNYTNYAWNKIYKSCLFDKIRYPEGKNFEDVFTTCKLIDQAKSWGKYNEVLYFYRQRKGSILNATTSVKKLEQIQNSIEARKFQTNFFKSHGYDYLIDMSNHWIMKDCMDYLVLQKRSGLSKNKFYSEVVYFLKNYKVSKIYDSKKYIIKLYLYRISPTLLFWILWMKDRI